jgi:hypothetical protein
MLEVRGLVKSTPVRSASACSAQTASTFQILAGLLEPTSGSVALLPM